MGRRAGAKQAGRSSGRARGSFLPAVAAQGLPEFRGGGGRGGGSGGGGAFPIWRRRLTSLEDVARPRRGGPGERRKRRAGTRGPGLDVNDPLSAPRVSPGARPFLGVPSPPGPPPPSRDVSFLRSPSPVSPKEPGLEPESGKAPANPDTLGLARVNPAPSGAVPLAPQTPPSSELASPGAAETRLGIRGPHESLEGLCSPLMGRGEGARSAHIPRPFRRSNCV
uniref:Basic proline-rich protein-like n=1 Tax=Tursiops truncatus TaxID=9739 RepID=A0A6J3R1W2_TURTR|nr:basic proline-rich protein-like [Tursiops truncatus]